jgi:NAD(P)-dependent dehydrogenase (short-subunit alcohol dehydrogenase family)
MSDAAIITGAAGSLGRAIAARLARDVGCVVLVDLPSDGLEGAAVALRDGFDGLVATVGCDITAPDAPAAILGELQSLGAVPRVLVNNAGINRDARAVKMTEEQFRAVVRVDLIAPARLAESLAPEMPVGSAILNIASRAALGSFGQVNYVAAKSGLIALTRALALQLAPRVRVNAIAPGLVDTPMTAGMPEHVLAGMIERVPAGRMASPEEIAESVAFHASPAASYVTGQMILCCGGRSVAP